MLILPQLVEIKWAGNSREHYESKGYPFTKVRESFVVNVLHLHHGSGCYVEVLCDYCEKIYKTTYGNYRSSKENKYNIKDCCKKCVPLKQKETNLIKYGVESTNQLESVRQKIRMKNLTNYKDVELLFSERGYDIIGEFVDSNTPIDYICRIHKNEGAKRITFAHLKSGQGCHSCARDRIRGENHYNWNGGITNLNIYLRDRMRSWTLDSLGHGDFVCDITKEKRNLVVHHLHNFSNIVIETLENLKLRIFPKVTDYSKEDLECIVNECTRLHYFYGFGIVLTEKIHREFHKIYGKKNNTTEQYYEFKNNYMNKIGLDVE